MVSDNAIGKFSNKTLYVLKTTKLPNMQKYLL